MFFSTRIGCCPSCLWWDDGWQCPFACVRWPNLATYVRRWVAFSILHKLYKHSRFPFSLGASHCRSVRRKVSATSVQVWAWQGSLGKSKSHPEIIVHTIQKDKLNCTELVLSDLAGANGIGSQEGLWCQKPIVSFTVSRSFFFLLICCSVSLCDGLLVAWMWCSSWSNDFLTSQSNSERQ